MGSVIDLAEATGVDVAVSLGRGQRAVAEKLLDHAQVGAPLEKVRREGMPEPVGMGEEATDRARVEPPASRREEQGVFGAPHELGP
jgi:hypothetical protein